MGVAVPGLARPVAGAVRELSPTAGNGYLPVDRKPSRDSSLPGSWYLLDRTKALPKLVDRPSMVPVGPRELVIFEKTKTRIYQGPSTRYGSLVTLPGDIGDKQLLLGCLPTIKGKGGQVVACTFNYCPGKRDGNVYGEIVAERCPAEFRCVDEVHPAHCSRSFRCTATRHRANVVQQKASLVATAKSLARIPGARLHRRWARFWASGPAIPISKRYPWCSSGLAPRSKTA
jgi:hypothetical protein